MELHRGRLIDHVQLVVVDIESSKRFYRAVCEALLIPIGGEGPDHIWVDELYISSVDSKAASGQLTGRAHLAFQASSREVVDRFHRMAIEAGGMDHGAPGERPYHPGYYAAFVLDPDGNNIEVVHHGEGKRSAASIQIDIG
jgi:catechol 2,3-dioxygenase-like lactoylglutathione lyase family enzyme